MIEIILQYVAVYGAGALALTELIKRVVKASGVAAVIISVFASFVVTIPVLTAPVNGGLLYWIGTAVAVILTINGVFKALAPKAAAKVVK